MIANAHLAHTRYWLIYFKDVWETNVPLHLHIRELDDAGNPQWHPEFAHWIDGTSGRSQGSEDRAKLKRAMKRLRERSLREYEVVYRAMVLGHSIPEIAEWLNDRAIIGGHKERYGTAEAMVIVYAAVDKLRDWW